MRRGDRPYGLGLAGVLLGRQGGVINRVGVPLPLLPLVLKTAPAPIKKNVGSGLPASGTPGITDGVGTGVALA